MNYYSLNKQAPNTTFKNAVIKGLAPDKGLYFPETITPLPQSFWDNFDHLSYSEIAFEAIKQFVSPEIPEPVLKTIVEETLSFDFPVVTLSEKISTLELFHGPTMAFKDVGARFMARCLGYFNKENPHEVTVLVATSGDTGGAVANGFLGVKGVNVVILYPSGKVSDIQEKQLTTLGQNIKALEVQGTFDDCQAMVKTAFLDETLTSNMQLTSANSINVARWLPQLFYFMFAYKQLHKKHQNIVFSVPSGNFGNICAGMMAQQLGLPITHFVASNNDNNVVTRYLISQLYQPRPSVQTISNAMDVGAPSNFIRIQEIYKNQFETLKENLSSYSFSDEETKTALKELYTEYNYVADPHGAVGYLGCKAFLKENPEAHCVFLETAHPTKFLDVVEEVIKEKQSLPEQIQSVMGKDKVAVEISTYEDLKAFLLN
ncbi:MAG: threonine synthase [Flavobacteriales bacterium]|nr:threonine synthase [Flavobacteriia bacterium]NCP06399.1 threonine synthase [Flavobacteriales bacterium]PIV94915.1 MAG: threonine synthase [Flavobacteriaceae bacterium CG17_big_fil_post_rev_8_21_14_2_50_33_15]PIY09547.1 MAG: threonine synthase [Flavobacteriaceae bacterium CG_4_10_14_3_um_filter_33_47]PJB17498.1 MAG: threonine synthase [Flavobacteriaceae bacterium CG_4_9_14_3_um_filter_33_16]